MSIDTVHLLCALAAFVLPMGFAWLIVSYNARPKRPRPARQERAADKLR